MIQLLSIHAGEYLVGSYIEKYLKNLSVWIPAKDTGIDLLISDLARGKIVTIQVKYSKDYMVEQDELSQKSFSAAEGDKLHS